MLNWTEMNNTYDCPPGQLDRQDGLAVHVYIFVPLYIFIILISVVGNISIVVVVCTRPAMQTFTHILICNCATADLLITLFSTVFSIVDHLKTKGKWYFGTFMCSFVHFCVISSVAANIVTLVVIAIDRLLAVTSPYKKILKNKLLVVIIPLVWCIAFGFASPIIFTQSVIHIEGHGPVCVEMWLPPFKPDSPKYYTVVLFICLYALPLTAMAFMYAFIAKKLSGSLNVKNTLLAKWRKQRQPEREDSPPDETCNLTTLKAVHHRTTGFQKRRVVRMLIVMLAAFAGCWFPVFFLQFLTSFHIYYVMCQSAIPQWAYALAYLIQYANSAIDPVLYFWFSSSYRKELKSLLQSLSNVIRIMI